MKKGVTAIVLCLWGFVEIAAQSPLETMVYPIVSKTAYERLNQDLTESGVLHEALLKIMGARVLIREKDREKDTACSVRAIVKRFEYDLYDLEIEDFKKGPFFLSTVTLGFAVFEQEKIPFAREFSIYSASWSDRKLENAVQTVRRGVEMAIEEWSGFRQGAKNNLVQSRHAKSLFLLEDLNLNAVASKFKESCGKYVNIRPVKEGPVFPLDLNFFNLLYNKCSYQNLSGLAKALRSGRDVRLGHGFSMSLNQKEYEIGDSLEITFQFPKPCHLLLLNYGTSGNVHVLYPNQKWEKSDMPAGQVKLPYPTFPKGKKFSYNISGPAGEEVLVAIVTSKPIPFESIGQNQLYRKIGSGEIRDLKARLRDIEVEYENDEKPSGSPTIWGYGTVSFWVKEREKK